jgi:hypothetical protein
MKDKDDNSCHKDRRPSTPQEKISNLLDSMLSFCGAESAAQALRDGICDTEKKEEKKSQNPATDNDKTNTLPIEEPEKSHKLKRSTNRDSIFRPPTQSKSPARARSDHGARDIDFIRVTLPKPGTSKFSDNSLPHMPSSSRLIRSSSSNCISEMENDATSYKYGDESFVSKKRVESPSPIRRSISRDKDVSHVNNSTEKDNNKRHAISAPHGGRTLIEQSACCNKIDDRLPPLPKNNAFTKKCDT